MRKLINEFSFSKFMSLVLSILCVVAGGGVAMAAVGLDDVGRTTADPDGTGDAVKNDPNAGTPLEGATPDSPRKGLEDRKSVV